MAAMRAALFISILAGCNQWIRPTPSADRPRNLLEQRKSTVAIRSTCDPFDDGKTMVTSRTGTGVIVSDWQVITALHVVDCPGAIPTIRVTNSRGVTWRMVPEREWPMTVLGNRDGVSRLQLASADSFAPGFDPPSVTDATPDLWDHLFIQTANPERKELIAEATGYDYGGATYGGLYFTYEVVSEPGNSGSPIFHLDGRLIGVHLGAGYNRDKKDPDLIRYGALVTSAMIPHR